MKCHPADRKGCRNRISDRLLLALGFLRPFLVSSYYPHRLLKAPTGVVDKDNLDTSFRSFDELVDSWKEYQKAAENA
jgi:hypothetical protein